MNFLALARERFSALDYERRWENTGAGLSPCMRIGLAVGTLIPKTQRTRMNERER